MFGHCYGVLAPGWHKVVVVFLMGRHNRQSGAANFERMHARKVKGGESPSEQRAGKGSARRSAKSQVWFVFAWVWKSFGRATQRIQVAALCGIWLENHRSWSCSHSERRVCIVRCRITPTLDSLSPLRRAMVRLVRPAPYLRATNSRSRSASRARRTDKWANSASCWIVSSINSLVGMFETSANEISLYGLR